MKETLKALREQFNYSQNSVAKFLGISRQMYIKYENGEADPPVKIIVALSGLYKVPYDFLIDNKITRQVPENNHRNVTYKYPEETSLAVADSKAVYCVEDSYSASIISMFSKLTFMKQLDVFSELAGIIQKSSKEEAYTKLETKKEKSSLEKFFEITEKQAGNSGGWKWNREELYDREICKHRDER